MLQEEKEGDGDRHNPMPKKQKLHENNMDEISDLSEPIVHQIMSCLNVSEITRISTLSKRFFSIWSSYPVIVFDETTFARTFQGRLSEGTIKYPFLDYIYNSVLRRRINKVLSEFRVKANLSGIDTYDRFDSVIGIVLVNGVRCIDLDLGVVSIKSCVILQDIDFSSHTLTEIEFDNCDVISIKINAPNLHSFSYGGIYSGLNPKPCSVDVSQCQNIAYMKLTYVVNGHWIEDLVYSLSNLETLILIRCQNIKRIKVWNEKLERFEVVDCPVLASIELSAKSLKSFRYKGVNYACHISFIASKLIKDLSIEGLGISDQWFESQIAKLNCLETLRIKGCNSLTNIKVWNEKLERFEVVDCPVLASIELSAKSLKSFRYKGVNYACHISFIASKLIKDLSIEGLGISDQWLESQIAKLHCLETLRLKGCNFLTNIKVFHDTLQILEFHRCLNLVEADIDTPQLVTFEYHGKLIKFCKMVSGGDCAATLDMESWGWYNDDQFYRWRDLLSYFGYFKPLKICAFQKQLMIPERLRDNLVPPLYDLQHLDIQIETLNEIDTDLVDSLLWLSPLPRTIRISSCSHFQMIIEVLEGDLGLTSACSRGVAVSRIRISLLCSMRLAGGVTVSRGNRCYLISSGISIQFKLIAIIWYQSMDTRSMSEMKKLIAEALETDRREMAQQMKALQVQELVVSRNKRPEDKVNSGGTGGSFIGGGKEKSGWYPNDIKVDILEYDGKLDPDEFIECFHTYKT
nr:hypothetical protein [Tanacetum cinerariifolium]